MKVIGHQAKGMNAVTEPLGAGLQQKIEAGTVPLVEKNGLAKLPRRMT
jgi:hypothetical protein